MNTPFLTDLANQMIHHFHLPSLDRWKRYNTYFDYDVSIWNFTCLESQQEIHIYLFDLVCRFKLYTFENGISSSMFEGVFTPSGIQITNKGG